ncbi:putative membrane protein [Desulfohalotomaculum tongense]|uniref:DUF1614 domain-containing protein n=1 Tax=Desulforadius tongensis TaxID=1216062 RepID=UPI00195DDC55|nr:DUF1614 domain-containing protein [Desulforadius tongensis]MBM7854638.1 putative membrane protein [Desulforadius tongensis]
MTQFPFGLIALIVVSFLIYFGLAHRVLDRMRLSDKAALGIIVALIIGSFITIPLPLGNIRASINVGGGIIPVALAIYLLSKAGTRKEWVRAIVATVVTGLVVYYVGSLVMRGLPEPAGRFGVIDSLYLYPLVAGITGYLAGRSRRSAFIAATLGVVLVDVFHFVWLVRSGATGGTVAIGGAGAFDVTVLSGIVAVLLAEIFGELRERLQGGPATEGRPDELLAGLKKPEINRHDEKAGAEPKPAPAMEAADIEVDDTMPFTGGEENEHDKGIDFTELAGGLNVTRDTAEKRRKE